MLVKAILAMALTLGAAGMLTVQDDPIPGCEPCPGAQTL